MFRFVAAGLSIHLPEPFIFVLWLSHQHLWGTISRRFVARGPRTISWQPFPFVFQLGVPPNTWRGAPNKIYKLRTCQSTGRGPKDCACQSFGRGFRKLCFITFPSSPRLPGALPGRREHTHKHMHSPAQKYALASLRAGAFCTMFSHLPVLCPSSGGSPGKTGAHTHKVMQFFTFCS